jgi:hypothetical protein
MDCENESGESVIFNLITSSSDLVNMYMVIAVSYAFFSLSTSSSSSIANIANNTRFRSRDWCKIEKFLAGDDWIEFLAKDPSVRSNTSVCLTMKRLIRCTFIYKFIYISTVGILTADGKDLKKYDVMLNPHTEIRHSRNTVTPGEFPPRPLPREVQKS